jgi:hypothetical protein
MKIITLLFELFLLQVVVVSFSVAQDTAVEKDDSQELIKIFQSPILNSEAWQSGDCLVGENLILDNVSTRADGLPAGILIEKKTYRRNAFDYEKRKYVSIKLSNSDYVDFDTIVNGEAKKESSIEWSAVFVDLTNGRLAMNGSKTRLKELKLKPNTTLEQINHELGFLDFRACWDRSGFGYNLKAFENAKRTVKIRCSGKGKFKSQYLPDNHLEFRFNAKSKVKDMGGPFMVYRFDLESSMPVYFSEFYTHKPSKTRVPQATISIDWLSFNDVYVPSGILLEEDIQLFLNEVVHKGRGENKLDFHWFSLNEELNEDLFQIESISSLEQISKFVDPITAEATQILNRRKLRDKSLK